MELSLEVGFQISKHMAHHGLAAYAPACVVTWGQVAEAIAQIILERGFPVESLTEETIVLLAEDVRRDLAGNDAQNWREIVLDRILTSWGINPALWEPEDEPDEGVLVEQFENAARLGDDEGLWVDGGISADLFEEN